MPINDSLTIQLARRAKLFADNVGLSQRRVARLLKIDESQYSKFLNGTVNLSAEATLALLRLTSMTKAQLELKFSNPDRLSSRIMNLQEKGKPMEFDGGGWVADQSGEDPNDSTGIDNTWKEGGEPSGDDIIDVLRQIDNIHAEARKAIADYINKVTQGKVNRAGVTESARSVNTNTKSSHPGSRGDLLSDPAKLKERLEFVRKERKKTEEQLELQAELDRERKLYWDARIKTLRKQEGQ
jgi:transcriptional regulator with XRE-family HTH domain